MIVLNLSNEQSANAILLRLIKLYGFELSLTKVRRFWEHQTYDNLLENII